MIVDDLLFSWVVVKLRQLYVSFVCILSILCTDIIILFVILAFPGPEANLLGLIAYIFFTNYRTGVI